MDLKLGMKMITRINKIYELTDRFAKLAYKKKWQEMMRAKERQQSQPPPSWVEQTYEPPPVAPTPPATLDISQNKISQWTIVKLLKDLKREQTPFDEHKHFFEPIHITKKYDDEEILMYLAAAHCCIACEPKKWSNNITAYQNVGVHFEPEQGALKGLPDFPTGQIRIYGQGSIEYFAQIPLLQVAKWLLEVVTSGAGEITNPHYTWLVETVTDLITDPEQQDTPSIKKQLEGRLSEKLEKEKPPTKRVCPNCGGDGEIEAWDEEYEEYYIDQCPTCNGEGYVR